MNSYKIHSTLDTRHPHRSRFALSLLLVSLCLTTGFSPSSKAQTFSLVEQNVYQLADVCRVEIEWFVNRGTVVVYSYTIGATQIPDDYNGNPQDIQPTSDNSETILRIQFDNEDDILITQGNSSFAMHTSISFPSLDESQYTGEEYTFKTYINLPKATADNRFIFIAGRTSTSGDFARSNVYRLTDDCPKGN